MEEMSAVTTYICGFNGFQQIELADKDSPELGSCCSIPHICRAVDADCTSSIVFEWSRIWQINGSTDTNVFGLRHKEIEKSLSAEKIHPEAAIPQKQDVILYHKQSGCNKIALFDDEAVKGVHCDAGIVGVTGATENDVYGQKDGQVYRGSLVKKGEHEDDDDDVVDVDDDDNNDDDNDSDDDEKRSLSLTLQPLDLGTVRVTRLSCGFDHTLMLTSTGEVLSCGSSSRGQLGLGDTSVDLVHCPTLVKALQGIRVAAIATGGWHSTAVTESGDLYVWGWNEAGQLGLPNGNQDNKRHLTQDTRVAGDLSRNHPSTHRSDKELGNKDFTSKEAGGIRYGDVAPGVPLEIHQDVGSLQVQPVPYGLEIPDDVSVRTVACGSRHTCVLLTSGFLLTTGWNRYGQLGLGHTASTDYLQAVPCFLDDRREKVVDVYAGYWNTAIITKGTRPRVHKETENEDQAQDQTDKLQ